MPCSAARTTDPHGNRLTTRCTSARRSDPRAGRGRTTSCRFLLRLLHKPGIAGEEHRVTRHAPVVIRRCATLPAPCAIPAAPRYRLSIRGAEEVVVRIGRLPGVVGLHAAYSPGSGIKTPCSVAAHGKSQSINLVHSSIVILDVLGFTGTMRDGSRWDGFQPQNSPMRSYLTPST